MQPPAQLPLDLETVVTQSGLENYFVSQANGLAFRQIESWQDWPNGKLILVGEAGSGKSHLARVWAEMVGATVIAAQELRDSQVQDLARGPVVVDDLGLITGDRLAETQLFHLHNLTLSEGHALLMTARKPPNRMRFELPDLQSRLGATTLAELEPPDDALLSAIVVKLFADRQIAISPGTLNYALPRLGRSFEAAQGFVAQMDARALAEGRPIGQKLARDVLGDALDNQP